MLNTTFTFPRPNFNRTSSFTSFSRNDIVRGNRDMTSRYRLFTDRTSATAMTRSLVVSPRPYPVMLEIIGKRPIIEENSLLRYKIPRHPSSKTFQQIFHRFSTF